MYNEFPLSRLMQMCDVPPRFADASLSDFADIFIQVGQSVKSIYVHGPQGTGKSHFLCACIRNVILEKLRTEGMESLVDSLIVPKKRPITYLSVSDLMTEFEQRGSPGVIATEDEILNKYSQAEFLVLDDLGAERISDMFIPKLYRLIDRRYKEMKRTMIASCLTLKDIAEKLHNGIASRIERMCTNVEFKVEHDISVRAISPVQPEIHVS